MIGKVNEVIGSSPVSFEEAARHVVERAGRTLTGVTGFEVLEKRVKVDAGGAPEYRVRMRLSFDLAPETVLHF